MKVRLYMMVQDPSFSPAGQATRLIEGYDVDIKLIGDCPITDRVEVVEQDQDQVLAKLQAPKPRTVLRKFELGQLDLKNPTLDSLLHSREFNQVSVLATALKTIAMYEDSDVLGRPVRWQWETEKATTLKIYPRWKEQKGAFYSRQHRRLEFNYFQGTNDGSRMICTSLSRDVVAHETGHAILDGIAPQLKDYPTYQSLAFHEAICDITAILIAISSGNLRKVVLRSLEGSSKGESYFNRIAEEYGVATNPQSTALRNLSDTDYSKVMKPEISRDRYKLSEVLSTALYAVLAQMHEDLCSVYSSDSGRTAYSVSGKALWDSRQQFKRITLGALDYLPPGHVCFADYGRAVIAADQASHPGNTEVRTYFAREFKARGIVSDERALEVTIPDVVFEDTELKNLVSDDQGALCFATRYRELLRIPEGAEFTVAPRLESCKKYYYESECGQGTTETRSVKECLFKVWWQDPNNANRTNGTTLAIGWKTKRPRVLLTSGYSDLGAENEALQPCLTVQTGQPLGITCLKDSTED